MKFLYVLMTLASLFFFANADEDGEDKGIAPSSGTIWVLNVNGAIGPASSDYLVRGFAKAVEADAALIVIEMNTPGGLDSAMRDIIKAILASPIPIATFVSPKGARAASAGTYILYASHIAAMAPATNLGAATPVQIGAPSLPGSKDLDEDENDSVAAGTTAMERKMVNDASAYIRSLAELYGRNADWAEKAVREAASLSASEALSDNVIDYVAASLEELIGQLRGKTIKINNTLQRLDLKDAQVHYQNPDWRTEILAVITNPNLVMILGMIGLYGIILEFYNPGALVPGVVGVICLLVAGYALQLLPVNYAGLALLAFGVSLMVAEALAPSFGILGVGGIVAFSVGGLMLFDTKLAEFQVAISALAAMGILTAAFIIITIQMAMKMRHQKDQSGLGTIIDLPGEVLSDFISRGEEMGLEGMVKVKGEIWKARADQALHKDDKIKVTGVDNLTLNVKKENT